MYSNSFMIALVFWVQSWFVLLRKADVISTQARDGLTGLLSNEAYLSVFSTEKKAGLGWCDSTAMPIIHPHSAQIGMAWALKARSYPAVAAIIRRCFLREQLRGALKLLQVPELSKQSLLVPNMISHFH
jgi:hypothetical protein